MKSKSFNMLFNPYIRIAGWQALAIGLIFMALTGILGAYSDVAFDGVLDMHLFEITLTQSFAYLGLGLFSLVLVMWIVGLLLSKDFRFIDILGTMTLAKAPFLILSIAGFFTTAPKLENIMSNPYLVFQNVSFMIMLFLSTVVIIWNIILMHNALKTSCNIKGNKLTIAFIAGLILSEILSKVLIYNLV